jgi:hypothetical protein
MLLIEPADYCPALRFKKGERDALKALHPPHKDRLLPLLVLPPMSHKEVEKNRPLTLAEYVRFHVGQMLRCWDTRPCLVDFR